MQHAIVILNDGETWTGIDGTTIVVLDDEQYDELTDGKVRVWDLKPTFKIALKDITP